LIREVSPASQRRVLLQAGGFTDITYQPVQRHIVEHRIRARDGAGEELVFEVDRPGEALRFMASCSGAPGPARSTAWQRWEWPESGTIVAGVVLTLLTFTALAVGVWDSLHLQHLEATVTANSRGVCSVSYWVGHPEAAETADDLECSDANEVGTTMAVWRSPLWQESDPSLIDSAWSSALLLPGIVVAFVAPAALGLGFIPFLVGVRAHDRWRMRGARTDQRPG